MRSPRDIFSEVISTIKSEVAKPTPEVGEIEERGISTERLLELILPITNLLQERIDAIIKILDRMKLQIISGGTIRATDPPSTFVIIEPTEAICQGIIYKTTADTNVDAFLDAPASRPLTRSILLDGSGHISVKDYVPTNEVILGKIVIPDKSTQRIQNDKTDSYDGYIILRKDLVFEDESVAENREMGDLLIADNLVGTIRLSEKLKLTNIHGTVEMDSGEIRIKKAGTNIILAKFNGNGSYFYAEACVGDNKRAIVEVAKFTKNGAIIGGWIIHNNMIESLNSRILLDGVNGQIIYQW